MPTSLLNFQNESTTSSTMKSETRLGLSLDAFVLFSLCFQFVLAIIAPWRKHRVRFILPIVWFAYLQESAVAYYAMGLIPNNTVQGGRTGEIRVFWAPYLILHLGGPSTITGLALSDNELWLRYAVRLISLSYTFGRVFLRSFLKSDLWVPTAIVFLAGSLRYIEKVICRFLARLTKFRDSILPKPDPGVNYAKLMGICTNFSEAEVPVEFHKSSNSLAAADQVEYPSASCPPAGSNKVKLSQVRIVKEAYKLFHDFRGLFVNAVYSDDLRDETRRRFLTRDAEDAFEICEVELNFAYDVFYTKSILIDKPVLRWLGLVSLLLQVVSTVLWIRIDKNSFHKSSVIVTHALVFGSISVDLFSFSMLAASDWDIAWVKHKKAKCFFEALLLLKKQARDIQRRIWRLRIQVRDLRFHVFNNNLRVFFRWSECIPQLNLIHTCAGKMSMKRIVSSSRDLNQWFRYTCFTPRLRDFIFEEMVKRSVHAKRPKDAEELCSARGMWALALLSRQHQGLNNLAETFRPWINDVDFEESLTLWHIATTLCYYTIPAGGDDDLRKCSRVLADYMLHLLIRPYTRAMPPSVQILGRKIYLDTCADAKRFFERKLPPHSSKARKEERRALACEKIMQVNTDVIPPRKIRGDKSKSVLFDGCLLAKELQRLKNETDINIWEISSQVWAEMLFHCAAHSRASVHLEKLSNGGDLLTLVWLLMTHLGLGNNQFRYKKDTSAELVIGKHMY